MIQRVLNITVIIIAIQLFCACNADYKKETNQTDTQTKVACTTRKLITKKEQDSITPTQVIKDLMAGNERFKNSNITERDHSVMIRKAAIGGQFPKAIVLSCIDSRVPVEDILDQGIGDLFVARVAGNFVNTDLLGSMEFACKVAGAKVILVMGHEHCGAIKGAIDQVQLGNITTMLTHINKPIEMSKQFKGDKTAKNEAYVTTVCKNNIQNTLAEIRAKSPLLKDMGNKGAIKIVGAYYSLLTGELVFLD